MPLVDEGDESFALFQGEFFRPYLVFLLVGQVQHHEAALTLCPPRRQLLLGVAVFDVLNAEVAEDRVVDEPESADHLLAEVFDRRPL